MQKESIRNVPVNFQSLNNSNSKVLLEFQGNFEIQNYDNTSDNGKEMSIQEIRPGIFHILYNQVYLIKGKKGNLG